MTSLAQQLQRLAAIPNVASAKILSYLGVGAPQRLSAPGPPKPKFGRGQTYTEYGIALVFILPLQLYYYHCNNYVFFHVCFCVFA